MEEETFHTDVERQKFLHCLMRPATVFCCKGCSLRVGVITALITDFLFALLKLINFVSYVGMFLEQDWPMWANLYFILWHGSNFTCFGFVTVGSIGIIEECARKMNPYSMFKQIEMFLLLVLSFWYYTGACIIEDPFEECSFFFTVIFAIIQFGWNIMFTYSVWSATVRLQANQATLVKYGVEIVGGVESGQVVIPGQVVAPAEVEFGQVSVDEGK